LTRFCFHYDSFSLSSSFLRHQSALFRFVCLFLLSSLYRNAVDAQYIIIYSIMCVCNSIYFFHPQKIKPMYGYWYSGVPTCVSLISGHLLLEKLYIIHLESIIQCEGKNIFEIKLTRILWRIHCRLLHCCSPTIYRYTCIRYM